MNTLPQTLDSYFRVLEPDIQSTLISAEYLSAIRRVASLFPTYVPNVFGFESRLNSNSGRTDFAINMTAKGSELLARRLFDQPQPEVFRQDERWQRISHFFREWGETNESPFADANSVWLEFDMDRLSAAELVPSVILFAYWLDQMESKMVVNRPLTWLTRTILPMLRGSPLPDYLERNFLHCMELTEPASYFQVGTMLSRKIDVLRLCMFNLSGDEILKVLSRIGVEESRSEIEQAIADFAGLVDSLCLHLDIGQVVYPRIGLELLYDHLHPWQRQPNKETRWFQLFDKLVERDLCTPEKREALLTWTGYVPMSQSLMPDGLLLRGLQHIKLVFCPNQPPEAKAYFGAAFNPLSRKKA
ncbi:MAG: hypothetical protein HCA25_13970 [Dolichospermum sp. DET50]|nr:hypothetical protein [Dolichospermum sp. DET66]MBS3033346.1 hypothetical protein [Dolichospermum sp. DET67]MBS3038550.1 hypothetical protein [Dolichospermum sp. DET50]QSX70426.1 MAG: hypothetical protein EZY12_13220 [Dolichospermum sp. DET69]